MRPVPASALVVALLGGACSGAIDSANQDPAGAGPGAVTPAGQPGAGTAGATGAPGTQPPGSQPAVSAACARPRVAPSPLRRLNGNEYDHSVRDLLDVDVRPADDFPMDNAGHGFDGIGDALTVSPMLLEKYMAALAQVAWTREEVDRLLRELQPRERQVIELRFGMGSDEPMTLEEVGKRLRLSRERIRQIEDKAKRKLRLIARARQLQDYLN
jgi:DNA-directed RNA polymerase specialized sigma24 family protein